MLFWCINCLNFSEKYSEYGLQGQHFSIGHTVQIINVVLLFWLIFLSVLLLSTLCIRFLMRWTNKCHYTYIYSRPVWQVDFLFQLLSKFWTTVSEFIWTTTPANNRPEGSATNHSGSVAYTQKHCINDGQQANRTSGAKTPGLVYNITHTQTHTEVSMKLNMCGVGGLAI